MSALLGGTVLAAFILNRLSIGRIEIARTITSDRDDLYEGDIATVEVTYAHQGGAPAAQVLADEFCPLVDPENTNATQQIYIPSLPKQMSQAFVYQAELYRRGVNRFPDVQLISKAPFGLFKRKKTVAAPTPILVYPELRQLKHLAFLDKQPTPQVTATRAGTGSEVIGVRPYQSGDSPRHIHWRSVAKQGRLISKEFAEETRPGVTLLLDLRAYPYPETSSKHTPFEWAVKASASIGNYALQRRYPLHIVADIDAYAPPRGSLTSSMLLEYLARVEAVGQRPLEELIEGSVLQTFVALILPWPDETACTAIQAINRRGLEALAVVINPSSFPQPGPDARPFANALQSADVEVALIQYGESWTTQLESSLRQPVRAYVRG